MGVFPSDDYFAGSPTELGKKIVSALKEYGASAALRDLDLYFRGPIAFALVLGGWFGFWGTLVNVRKSCMQEIRVE